MNIFRKYQAYNIQNNKNKQRGKDRKEKKMEVSGSGEKMLLHLSLQSMKVKNPQLSKGAHTENSTHLYI